MQAPYHPTLLERLTLTQPDQTKLDQLDPT